jgi:CRISPR-associated protein Cas1
MDYISNQTRIYVMKLEMNCQFLFIGNRQFYFIIYKVLTTSDFETNFNGILLSENGRKKFLREYNGKLDSVIKHPNLNVNVSYKRLIRLELYKIQKHITENQEYKGFVARW